MRKLSVVLLAFVLFVPLLANADTPPAPAATAVTAPAAAPALVAPAPVVTVTPTDTPTPPPNISNIVQAQPSTFIDNIRTAFSSKAWGMVVGYILMLIVYLIVTFAWSDFPADWLPHLSIALGVIGNVGWELTIGGQVWWQAILAGITTGLTATGMWETPKIGGKALFGSIGDKQDAAKKAALIPPPPATGGSVPKAA